MSGITEGAYDPYTKHIDEEVTEIEKHLHNNEHWFGAAASATGETHVADEMDGVILPFPVLSGASDFGSWVQLLGSSDTPVEAGMVKFDPHRFLTTTVDSTVQFIIQIISGESSGFAAKLAAKDYTSFPYISLSNNNDSGISSVMSKRIQITTGSKLWIRCACVGQTGKTINLYFGLHEYLE